MEDFDIDFEVCRVAAAFEMQEYESTVEKLGSTYLFDLNGQFTISGLLLEWNRDIGNLSVTPKQGRPCQVAKNDDTKRWEVYWDVGSEEACRLMARALYRLNFRSKSVFAQLAHITKQALSDEEKLELRREMRERVRAIKAAR